MGGFMSVYIDGGKEIHGILAAESTANHPNYLAILNVDKASQKTWDEVKVGLSYFNSAMKENLYKLDPL